MPRTLTRPSPEGWELIQLRAEQVVEEAMSRLYECHPEWTTRFGPRGREFCRQDLHYHLEYLNACLETGHLDAFPEYARWLASVLQGRGLEPGHLAESFAYLGEAWAMHLGPEDLSIVRAVLQAGIDALTATEPYRPAFYRHLPESHPVASTLTEALLAGNRVAARGLLFGPLEGGAKLVDVSVGLVQPAMYEVGQLWQSSRVSIAQEHLATAICQSLLAQAFAAQEFEPPSDRKALFACVEGNHHALGLRMVSDAFEVAGWEVQFLGADTPVRSLLAQVDHFRPELVGLSVSLPSQVVAAKRLIGELRSEMGSRRPAIMVGGLALNQLDDLWRGLEADLWSASAKTALAESR